MVSAKEEVGVVVAGLRTLFIVIVIADPLITAAALIFTRKEVVL